MKARLDSTLLYMWILNIIVACFASFTSGINLLNGVSVDDQVERILLLISICTSFIIVAALVTNILILPLILTIYKMIDKRIHPEKYIPLSNEKLAQDLHDLADALEREDKNNA